MGNVTTDDRNPGRRNVQRFTVQGGLDGNRGDQESRPINFLLLKNCLVDKRLNALVRRPGSQDENMPNSLGLPLGCGEYVASSNGQTIPITTTKLLNFGGSSFYQDVAGTRTLVSKTSYVNFATSNPCSFAKLGSNMFIAGGLPAKWGGPGKTIDRVGIIPPSAPVTIASSSSGTGITLSSGTSYVITYFDSSTGLESDWSTPSDSTGVVANHAITITIPAATAKNWDKIRIYRYLDGGAFPYLVDTVVSGTTTYTDIKPDAQLTAKADKRYNKACPPTQAYLCAKYAQCIWYVDGSNPYKIVFSKPFTGSDTDLEYFPITNYVMSNEPITGLLVVPGKMLLFHPRSISYISGFSTDDFVFQPLIQGAGTLFSGSIATNGSDVVFLAEQGFMAMPASGGYPRHISREIDLDLQPILAASYNATISVSCCWSTSMRQFIYALAAQSTAGAQWEESGTGVTTTAVTGWETPTFVTDIWEDLANVNSNDSMTIRYWGWSPELSGGGDNLWHEYTLPYAETDNTDGIHPTFLFHPSPSSDTGDPQQDKTYMGFWDGNQGRLATLFRRDKTDDNGAFFDAIWITRRLVPGNQDGGYKLFQRLSFSSAYSDPQSDSGSTLSYLIDFDDPHLRTYGPSLITFLVVATDSKKFPTMLGRFIHLYGIDTAQSSSKVLLSEIFIHYRERFRREGR